MKKFIWNKKKRFLTTEELGVKSALARTHVHKVYADGYLHDGPNLNTVVVGCAGSGTGSCYIRPNIDNPDGSGLFLVTRDPEDIRLAKSVYKHTSVIDFKGHYDGEVTSFHPVTYIKNESDAVRIADALLGTLEAEAEFNLFYVVTVRKMLSYALFETAVSGGDFQSVIDRLQTCTTIPRYLLTQLTSLLPLFTPTSLDLPAFVTSEEPSAVIVLLPTNDISCRPLVSCLLSQLFTMLSDRDPADTGAHIKVMIEDTAEFYIPNLPKYLAINKRYDYSIDTCWASLEQMEYRYKRDSGAILTCCNLVMLGCQPHSEDAVYYSKRCGSIVNKLTRKKNPVFSEREIALLPADQCLVLVNGTPPYVGRKA